MTRCRDEIQTYHLPDNERMRFVLRHIVEGHIYIYYAVFLKNHSALSKDNRLIDARTDMSINFSIIFIAKKVSVLVHLF